MNRQSVITGLVATLFVLGSIAVGPAEDPKGKSQFTSVFPVDKANLVSSGRNPYFVLEPGYRLHFKAEDATLVVTVREAQTIKIIDDLATDGFFDRADDLKVKVQRPPHTMPGYTLTVTAEEVALREDLGRGLPMLRRLDALRTMLDGDAAKEMDLLPGRLSGLRAQWETEGPTTAVAAPAETQAEAIGLAKEDDLASLEKADYANIKRFREEFANVLVIEPTELKQLREALLVKAVPPSAGEQLYKVTFWRGERAVRGIWVYDHGEWGFTRRTGSHWTVGTNLD
jgi:hypothetical protein